MNACKRMSHLLMMAMVGGILFTACSKSSKETAEPVVPQVTEVGNVFGQATTATINAQGGTVATPDGQVSITIPAGALTSSTVISIQSVENTNPGGFGLNYRLLPHGISFAKPVSIKFSYAQYVDSIALQDALAIAYQDEDRVWKIPKGFIVDKVKKEVSVQSTHFSDWSVMNYLSLKPVYSILQTGQQLTLTAWTCVDINDQLEIIYVMDDDSNPVVPVSKLMPLPAKFIKQWELGGEGKLDPKGNTALYTAPANEPSRNPVAVSVRLNTNAITLLLVSNIRIAPEGVWVQSDQQEGLGYRSYIMSPTTGDFGLQWRAAAGSTWQGALSGPISGVGTYSWSQDIQFWYEEPLRFGDHSIISFFEEGTRAVPSSGYIKVTKWGRVGEMISGEFLINKAGRYDSNSGGGELVGLHVIKGFFNVIRE